MSDPRQQVINHFLASAGWADALRLPLAGDASARRYVRLTKGMASAVLMDADPRSGERVDRFMEVGRWLCDHDYSAPALLASDTANGLLLLEDLGDDLVARLVASDPARERSLYLSIMAFLCDLHRHRPPGFLAVADGAALADLSGRIVDWYLSAVDARPTPATGAIASEIARLHDHFSDGALVMSLRDFHAENLIWLPGRNGPARIGLLDFQDAFATHPAYDLVSLCQDARRDVSAATEAACLASYVQSTGRDAEGFAAIYALLGAQRALRIMAVFARLCLRSGKAHYLDYMPRVWAYLIRNLAHPGLAPLARAVADGLPPPTPEALHRIKQKCGTRPDL